MNKNIFFLSLSFIFLLTFFVAKFFAIENKQISNKKDFSISQVEQKKEESIFSINKLTDLFSAEKSIFLLLFFAFLIGFLTSFTPCVYPMIPITIGVLQTQATKTVFRNFLLSLFYVLGIATVYSALGYFVAKTNLFFGKWLGNPWVITFIVLIFIYLAFSMFGFYEIRLPKFLSKKENIKVKGSLFLSFLFGAVSGLVASPCLTPPLAILLSFAAKSANPLIGFLLLWFFAFGMGLLLIIVGAFSASIYVLPRAGMWMLQIKKFFGFVLLAIAIYFIQPFFEISFILKMYAVLSGVASFYYLSTSSKEKKFRIFMGFFLAIVCLVFLSMGLSKKQKLLAANYQEGLIVNKKIAQVKIYKKDQGQMICFGKRHSACLRG